MRKSTTSTIVTTACIGAAMGAAAYVINNNHSMSNTRKFKRSTGKALRQVGDFISSVSNMMR